jgi:hypothetical protein
MTDDEAKVLAATLTPNDLHKVLLAMIDSRMGLVRASRTAVELTALADACAAYEAVAFPMI